MTIFIYFRREEPLCLLCNEIISDLKSSSTITRGLAAIVAHSKKLGDDLYRKFERASPLILHNDCRQKYIRIKSLGSKSAQNDKTVCHPHSKLRSSINKFNFEDQCLFCGELLIDKRKRKNKQKKVVKSQTKNYIKSIRDHAVKRGDKKGDIILTRLQNISDLIAAEAQYHKDCALFFFTNKEIPKKKQKGRPKGKQSKIGQPPNAEKTYAFNQLCKFIETNKDKQYSITELNQHMSVILNGKSGWENKTLKAKLRLQYGDNIVITSSAIGKPSYICFRETADTIIETNQIIDDDPNQKEARLKIVQEAAQIILDDIKKNKYDNDYYGAPDCLESDVTEAIPDTLNFFLEQISASLKDRNEFVTRRRLSIAHAIISLCLPRRFVSPLLLSLGVYIHRKYASKELISILSALGFSESYTEIQRYENSIMISEEPQMYNYEGFLQFVFDNFDFNVNTYDGKNTKHIMGGIVAVTPKSRSSGNRPVKRVKDIPNASSVGSFGQITMKNYKKSIGSGLKSVHVKDITNAVTLPSNSLIISQTLELLWMTGYLLKVPHTASWNEFNERATCNGTYDVSSIDFLPFINLDPNNPNTIYTALCFVQEICIKNNIKICPVTFDQPLYQKAVDILLANKKELDRIFVRLGGFHFLMSAMGALGNIMEGSGLEDLWATVYAKGAVPHMMKGKAYSRALRAHILTQAALNIIIVNELRDNLDEEKLKLLYTSVLSNKETPENDPQDNTIPNISVQVNCWWTHLAEKDRTIKLWQVYNSGVNAIKLFLRAEKTGDWGLHLYSVQELLPFFHAAGHMPYAKSAHLYLQQMLELRNKMSTTDFENFTSKGYFTIRRSNRFWAGIFSDQTIEQWLMRQCKSPAGLTRGRGFTDSTASKFVHALPKCVHLCHALEIFAGAHSLSSEQHRNLSQSTQIRDLHDVQTFVNWLLDHNLFSCTREGLLMNIANGFIADASINCDNALNIGLAAINKMTGKCFFDLSLSRKDKVKSLAATTNSIEVHGQEVVINPNLLFNRMSCVLNTSAELGLFLSYELCPEPPCLFDSGQLRKTDKSKLRELLLTNANVHSNKKGLPNDSLKVLDGGHFLHCVKWPETDDVNYDQLCDHYLSYALNNFGDGITVVFDGYGRPHSIKNQEQNRRKRLATSANISIAAQLLVTVKQKEFLNNEYNKSALITLLSDKLVSHNIHVKHAVDDADTLIAETALEMAHKYTNQVYVIGTDTDLLVLLVGRQNLVPDNLHMNYETKVEQVEDNFVKVYNTVSIQDLQISFSDLRAYLPFLHAISGCDTTSALYSKGKKTVVKMVQENQAVRDHMNVFLKSTSSYDEVAEAGEKFLLALYGAANFESLNKYRSVAYKRGVAKMKITNQFKLETLPPTSEAAKQHSLRVYLQVQIWLGNSELSPTDWGWKLRHTMLEPVRTDKPVAHPKLLNLVSCKCKNGCKASCTCRKFGLQCTDICAKCSEIGCTNITLEEDIFCDISTNSETEDHLNCPQNPNCDYADESTPNVIHDSMVFLNCD